VTAAQAIAHVAAWLLAALALRQLWQTARRQERRMDALERALFGHANLTRDRLVGMDAALEHLHLVERARGIDLETAQRMRMMRLARVERRSPQPPLDTELLDEVQQELDR
jgi:hypothetical protein